MTSAISQDQPPLFYSTLADDPDLAEIVEMFVLEMPERVANLIARHQAGELQELERAAHQIKGAAGSYGFNQLTPAAARLEDTLKQKRPTQEIRQALDELARMCNGIRAGLPG